MMTPQQMTTRRIVNLLAADRRVNKPAIWPCVLPEDDSNRLLCMGDIRRRTMQVGAEVSTPKNPAVRQSEVAGRAESIRLRLWMSSHAKAIFKMSSVDQILPLISADVFLDSSDSRRRRLMLQRALQKRSKAAAA
jgi:hypothetical protein